MPWIIQILIWISNVVALIIKWSILAPLWLAGILLFAFICPMLAFSVPILLIAVGATLTEVLEMGRGLSIVVYIVSVIVGIFGMIGAVRCLDNIFDADWFDDLYGDSDADFDNDISFFE
jgi:hypothetical protein